MSGITRTLVELLLPPEASDPSSKRGLLSTESAKRNGETIKPPAFAHTFRHVYQFILQATDGDTAAASAMFQQYLAGELSEELLALSRRWVQKDQRSGRTQRRNRLKTVLRDPTVRSSTSAALSSEA
jgi:hypothetical protein